MTLFFIIIGYFTMLKCCLYSCLGIFIVPCFIVAMRRAQRPQWMPAPPNFMQNLVRTRFNAEVTGGSNQCAICLTDFTESDEVIPLPCDKRHVFHTECIEGWLKNNNACPMCKAPITQEALNNQRNQQ